MQLMNKIIFYTESPCTASCIEHKTHLKVWKTVCYISLFKTYGHVVTLEQVIWVNTQKTPPKHSHINLLIILNCAYLFLSISFMLIKINCFTDADVSGHVKFRISQLWNQWLLSSQLHVRSWYLITEHDRTPFTAREVALQHFCHTWHFQALTNREIVVN